MITLGSKGDTLTVYLFRDAMFYVPMVATDPWPDGVTIELHLISNQLTDDIVWTATIDGSTAAFNESPDQVNAAIDAKVYESRLFYVVDGIGPLGWAHGGVNAT